MGSSYLVDDPLWPVSLFLNGYLSKTHPIKKRVFSKVYAAVEERPSPDVVF